jgi:pimeloyl-ACP methyl ester carboxylesterase
VASATQTNSVERVNLPASETIAYQRRPGELSLVLLHGNVTSSKHFDTVLEGIDDRFDCYAMDVRGVGASTYETPVDRLEEYVDDVVAFADAMGLETFHLLGWSTGGDVATVVVARHPERVGSPSSAPVGTRGYPFDAKDEEGNPTDRGAVANDPVQTGPLAEAREAGNRELYRATWDALIDGHNSPEPDRYEAYVGDMLTQHNLVDFYYTLARFTISEEANACGEGSGLAPKLTPSRA